MKKEKALTFKMPSGKHAGLAMKSILEGDPAYIVWLYENTPNDMYTFKVAEALITDAISKTEPNRKKKLDLNYLSI